MGNGSWRGGRVLHRCRGTVLGGVHWDSHRSGSGSGRGWGASPHSHLKGSNEVVECLEGSRIPGQFIVSEWEGDGQRPN